MGDTASRCQRLSEKKKQAEEKKRSEHAIKTDAMKKTEDTKKNTRETLRGAAGPSAETCIRATAGYM
jgi:hypothetical protein